MLFFPGKVYPEPIIANAGFSADLKCVISLEVDVQLELLRYSTGKVLPSDVTQSDGAPEKLERKRNVIVRKKRNDPCERPCIGLCAKAILGNYRDLHSSGLHPTSLGNNRVNVPRTHWRTPPFERLR